MSNIIATITPFDYDEKEYAKVKLYRDYAKKSVHHGLLSFGYGAPFHGDLMYHQMFNVFNDNAQRKVSLDLGKAWKKNAKEIHVYTDLGLNQNMINLIDDISSTNHHIPIYEVSIKNKIKKSTTINELIKKINTKEEDLDAVQNYQLDYSFTPNVEYTKDPIIIPKINFDEYKCVIMESPFAGAVKDNVKYAKQCIFNLALKGYAPSASHLLYTQMLDDTKQSDRELGIDKGLDIAHDVDTIIMVDRGYSNGMKYGYLRAKKEGRNISFKTISDDPIFVSEVEQIKNWDEFVDFVENYKQKNKELFEKTGFITQINQMEQEYKSKLSLKK